MRGLKALSKPGSGCEPSSRQLEQHCFPENKKPAGTACGLSLSGFSAATAAAVSSAATSVVPIAASAAPSAAATIAPAEAASASTSAAPAGPALVLLARLFSCPSLEHGLPRQADLALRIDVGH